MELRIGPDLLLTGYVFSTPIRYDSESVTLSITRARRARRTWSTAPRSINPGNGASKACKRSSPRLPANTGSRWSNDAAVTLGLEDHTLEPGETAFESIDRLLTLSRLFSTDDGQGRLVIARAGSAGRAVDTLELGKNLLSGDTKLDFSSVFSEYVSKGQRSGTDDELWRRGDRSRSPYHDPRVNRRRVKIIQQSGQMNASMARERVEWERANAVGKALAGATTSFRAGDKATARCGGTT